MKRHTSFGVIVVFQRQFLDVRFNVDEVQVCFIRTIHSSRHENVPVHVAILRQENCIYIVTKTCLSYTPPPSLETIALYCRLFLNTVLPIVR